MKQSDKKSQSVRLNENCIVHAFPHQIKDPLLQPTGRPLPQASAGPAPLSAQTSWQSHSFPQSPVSAMTCPGFTLGHSLWRELGSGTQPGGHTPGPSASPRGLFPGGPLQRPPCGVDTAPGPLSSQSFPSQPPRVSPPPPRTIPVSGPSHGALCGESGVRSFWGFLRFRLLLSPSQKGLRLPVTFSYLCIWTPAARLSTVLDVRAFSLLYRPVTKRRHFSASGCDRGWRCGLDVLYVSCVLDPAS